MRITTIIAASLCGALIALPASTTAQVSLSVSLSKRLGPEVSLAAYSPAIHGEWKTSYRHWTPVTLYEYGGRYYHHSVSGARAVGMYSHNNQVFLPPTDRAWLGYDRRYNYKRVPNDDDRGRVHS